MKNTYISLQIHLILTENEEVSDEIAVITLNDKVILKYKFVLNV